MAGGVLALGLWLALGAGPAWGQWRQVNTAGFGGLGANSTYVMTPFRGALFAATAQPGVVHRTDGVADRRFGRFHWETLALPASVTGVPRVAPREISAAAVLRVGRIDWLHIVVANDDAGTSTNFILKTSDGVTWTLTGNVQSGSIEYTCLGVFGDRLYAAIGNPNDRRHPESFRLFRTDGAAWEEVATDIAFGPGDVTLDDMAEFRGDLYASTGGQNETGDHAAEVWRTRDGAHWTRVAQLNSPTMAEAECMAVFDGSLYVGTKNHPTPGVVGTGPELWRSRDGTTWEKVATEGQFPSESLHLDVLQPFDGRLYAGLGGASGGARLFSSRNGSTWTEVTPEGLASDRANYLVGSMAVAWDKLYVGTGMNTGTGTEIWEYTPSPLRPGEVRKPPERVVPLPPRLGPPPPPEQTKALARTPLAELRGIDPRVARALGERGIDSVERLASANPAALARLAGIDPGAARSLVTRARLHLSTRAPRAGQPKAAPRNPVRPPGA